MPSIVTRSAKPSAGASSSSDVRQPCRWVSMTGASRRSIMTARLAAIVLSEDQLGRAARVICSRPGGTRHRPQARGQQHAQGEEPFRSDPRLRSRPPPGVPRRRRRASSSARRNAGSGRGRARSRRARGARRARRRRLPSRAPPRRPRRAAGASADGPGSSQRGAEHDQSEPRAVAGEPTRERGGGLRERQQRERGGTRDETGCRPCGQDVVVEPAAIRADGQERRRQECQHERDEAPMVIGLGARTPRAAARRSAGVCTGAQSRRRAPRAASARAGRRRKPLGGGRARRALRGSRARDRRADDSGERDGGHEHQKRDAGGGPGARGEGDPRAAQREAQALGCVLERRQFGAHRLPPLRASGRQQPGDQAEVAVGRVSLARGHGAVRSLRCAGLGRRAGTQASWPASSHPALVRR